MRIAIAKDQGWKRTMKKESSFLDPSKDIEHEEWLNPNGYFERKLPEYTQDLNAMHEVEKTLNGNDEMRACYEDILDDNGRYYATALQRAEAYLRVINKWKD